MRLAARLSWLLALAVLWFFVGCANTVSSIGDIVLSPPSTRITLKVIGGSNRAEIRYFRVNQEDESSGNPQGFQDRYRSSSDNVPREQLPWSAEVILDSDERVYLQVRTIEFHDEVRVQIWREYELLKEGVISISNRALVPLSISYSPSDES